MEESLHWATASRIKALNIVQGPVRIRGTGDPGRKKPCLGDPQVVLLVSRCGIRSESFPG